MTGNADRMRAAVANKPKPPPKAAVAPPPVVVTTAADAQVLTGPKKVKVKKPPFVGPPRPDPAPDPNSNRSNKTKNAHCFRFPAGTSFACDWDGKDWTVVLTTTTRDGQPDVRTAAGTSIHKILMRLGQEWYKQNRPPLQPAPAPEAAPDDTPGSSRVAVSGDRPGAAADG